MDTTHTVRFELPPSRALRFCIGLAILYAIWACRGLLYVWLFSFFAPTDGLRSVTGIVVPLLIEFVIMLGSLGLLVATVGWRVIADVVSGTAQMFKQWRATSVAAQQAGAAATQAAQVAGATSAGAAAGAVAATTAQSQRAKTFAEKIQDTLRDQDMRIKSLESQSGESLAILKEMQTASKASPTRARAKRATQ